MFKVLIISLFFPITICEYIKDDSDLDPSLKNVEVNLIPAQTRLIKHIFNEQYDNEVSTVIEEKHRRTDYRFIYTMQLVRLKLVDLDEPKEQMSVTAEFIQIWSDDRLKWNSSDFDNITIINLRLDKVWSPPFTVFSASEFVDQRDADFRTVTLWQEGTLLTRIPMKIATNCELNVD